MQFLAEETVNLSRTLARQGDSESLDAAKEQVRLATERLDQVRTGKTAAAEVVALKLAGEIDELTALKTSVDKDFVATTASVAEFAARQAATAQADPQHVRQELAALRAKAAALNDSKVNLERSLAAKRRR